MNYLKLYCVDLIIDLSLLICRHTIRCYVSSFCQPVLHKHVTIFNFQFLLFMHNNTAKHFEKTSTFLRKYLHENRAALH